MTQDATLVRAAGGVIWRSGASGATEVLVVHRPRYDDWTFPKGKLDPGETWEQAAVREVLEETGIVAELGYELAAVDYVDNQGRPKRARYWAMTVVEDRGFEPGHEISAREWLTVGQTPSRLSYRRDADVLASFTELHR